MRIVKNKKTKTVLMVFDSMVKTLLTQIHGDMFYEHEGQTKTERIQQSYWWREMDQDINEFLAKCDNCQKTKQKTKQETKNHLIPLPQCSEPN
jgi:hypothetical protein